MTCLLAYALLFPKGLLPQGYELAVVQSRFFEVSWGLLGRILFLIIAAAFLSDTWLATVDAVSRIHTDCLYAFFPASQSISVRSWYLIFLFLLTAITSATMGFAEPGPLILLSAVIGFVGTVLFSVAVVFQQRQIAAPHPHRRTSRSCQPVFSLPRLRRLWPARRLLFVNR